MSKSTFGDDMEAILDGTSFIGGPMANLRDLTDVLTIPDIPIPSDAELCLDKDDDLVSAAGEAGGASTELDQVYVNDCVNTLRLARASYVRLLPKSHTSRPPTGTAVALSERSERLLRALNETHGTSILDDQRLFVANGTEGVVLSTADTGTTIPAGNSSHSPVAKKTAPGQRRGRRGSSGGAGAAGPADTSDVTSDDASASSLTRKGGKTRQGRKRTSDGASVKPGEEDSAEMEQGTGQSTSESPKPRKRTKKPESPKKALEVDHGPAKPAADDLNEVAEDLAEALERCVAVMRGDTEVPVEEDERDALIVSLLEPLAVLRAARPQAGSASTNLPKEDEALCNVPVMPAHIVCAFLGEASALLGAGPLAQPCSDGGSGQGSGSGADVGGEANNSQGSLAAAACTLRVVVSLFSLQILPVEAYTEECYDRIITSTKHLLSHLAVMGPKMAEGEGRGRRRSSSTVSTVAVGAGATSSPLQSACAVFRMLVPITRERRLVDAHVLHLSNVAREPLFGNHSTRLQAEAVPLISTMFGRYSSHRTMMLEDLFHDFGRLSNLSRRSRQPSYHTADTDVSVQPLSAVLLHMAQSVAANDLVQGGIESARRSSESTCRDVCSQLVQTCIAKKSDDVDIRSVLDDCLKDWLKLLSAPEWTAAGRMIACLCAQLSALSQNATEGKDQRARAVDLLGLVVATLVVGGGGQQTGACPSTEDSERQAGTNNEDRTLLLGDKENVAAFLRAREFACKQAEDVPQSCLMHSALAYHRCTVLDENQAEHNGDGADPDHESTSNATKDQDESSSSSGRAKGRKKGKGKGKKGSRRRGSNSCAEDDVSSAPQASPDPPQGLDSNLAPADPPSRAIACAAAGRLQLGGTLARFEVQILGRILAATTDSRQTQLRQRALRALCHIVDAETSSRFPVDDSVLSREQVRTAVYDRFLDVAVSVREAALDLIGHHIHRCAAVGGAGAGAAVEKYQPAVVRALSDKGTSVRKRALRIIHDMHALGQGGMGTTQAGGNTGENDGASSAGLVLCAAQRLQDPEETVSDLSRKCLEAMLLSGTAKTSQGGTVVVEMPMPKLLAVPRDDAADVVAGLRSGGREVPMADRVKEICRVLAEVAKRNTQPAWLVDLIRQAGEAHAEKLALCKAMVSWVLDEMGMPKSKKEAPRDDGWLANLVDVVGEAHPALLLEHVVAMRVFVKQGIQPRVVMHIAHALARTLPLFEAVATDAIKPSREMLLPTEADLIRHMHSAPNDVVVYAAQCLAVLSEQVTGNHRALCDRIYLYYRRLCQGLVGIGGASASPVTGSSPGVGAANANTVEQQIKSLQMAPRIMFILGALCRFYDTETNFDAAYNSGGALNQNSEQAASYFEREDVYGPIAATLTRYFALSVRDVPRKAAPLVPALQSTALQALGHLFVRSPSQMFRCLELVRNALQQALPKPEPAAGAAAATTVGKAATAIERTTQQLARTVLKMLTDMLNAEEENMKSTAYMQSQRLKHDDRDYSIDAITEENADSGISSSFLQKLAPTLLALLSHPSGDTRRLAIVVVAKMLKAGMVHPASCVSELVALHTDPVEIIRHHAQMLLQQEVSKHGEYVIPNIPKGIGAAWRFHACLETAGQAKMGDAAIADTLGKVYGALAVTKQQRLSFLTAMLRQLSSKRGGAQQDDSKSGVGGVGASSGGNANAGEVPSSRNGRMRYLRFVCLVLSRLPYGNVVEVMHVEKEINRVVSLQGTTLLSKLGQIVGGQGNDSNDPPETDEGIEVADEVLKGVAWDTCEELAAVCHLLSLKAHMGEAFCISNTLRASTGDKLDKTPVRRGTAAGDLHLDERCEPGDREAFSTSRLLEIFRSAHAAIESDSFDNELQWRAQGGGSGGSKRSRSSTTPATKGRKRKSGGGDELDDETMMALDAAADMEPTRRSSRRRTSDVSYAEEDGDDDEPG